MSSDALPEKMVDFRDYLAVLKRRRWVILLTTVAVIGAVSLWSLRQTEVYQSRAEVLLQPISVDPFATGNNRGEVNVSAERQLADSGTTGELARQALGVDRSVGSLKQALVVEASEDAQTLTFLFSDPSPEFAQRGAQAFADAYLKFKFDQAQGTAVSTINGLNAQAAVLNTQLTDATNRLNAAAAGSPERAQAQATQNQIQNSLNAIQNQIATIARINFTAGTVIEPANVPGRPVSPNHGRNIAMGVVGGLLLGLLAAFARDRLDDRVATHAEGTNRYLGYPVLATVPRQPRRLAGERVVVADPDSLAADAYRRLRSNVVFRLAQDDAKVVVVSSAFAGDGKTTTAANLALALTHLGKRVLLVSADLRRPSLHRLFGVENVAGLTEVLIGLADVEDVVQRVPGVEGLEILTSGGETERPAELLQDEPLRRLLEEQRERVDVVVIDSAPVLAVADTLSLAALADGVVMVVDSTSTTRQTLREAADQLDAVGARIIGVVVNKAQPTKRPRYTKAYDVADAKAGAVRLGTADGRSGALEPPAAHGNGNGATNGDGATPGRLRPLSGAPEAESA